MHRGAQERLSNLHERYGDAPLTAATILLALLMFVAMPLYAVGFSFSYPITATLGLALILSGLIMSGHSTALLFFLLVAFALQAGTALSRSMGNQSANHLLLLASAWLIFSVTMTWIVSRAVFGLGRVTTHRIMGAIFLYLLVALTFSSIFVFVGLSIPGAFSGITFDDNPALTSTLFYFSIVSLTSTGYGDIFPVHPIARSLCNLETIVGQLYPATLLARLVALEIEGRRS